MNILIYDSEIKKAIKQKDQPEIPGIEYCGGWGDKKGMGISVITAADYKSGRSRVFMDDNKNDFAEAVEAANIIVGFNTKQFDNPLVEACWEIKISHKPQYDILKEVWAVVGRKKGYKLNDICFANFGIEKTDDGAMAPIYWQRGEYGRVIDYCMNDTKMTQLVFEKIRTDGFLIDPVTGGKINLTINFSL